MSTDIGTLLTDMDIGTLHVFACHTRVMPRWTPGGHMTSERRSHDSHMTPFETVDKNGTVDFEEFADYMASLSLVDQTPPQQEVEDLPFPVPVASS